MQAQHKDINQAIKSEHLHSAILAGAEQVALRRDVLNNANGFPVPDRDTGNNLTYLMQYIARHLEKYDTIHDIMGTVSNAAIMGARGNSGAIFSQFLNGFKDAAPRTSEMSIDAMIECFQKGYHYAYNAIQEPKEGTIITAIRSWVEGLKTYYKDNLTLEQIYESAFNTLNNTVQNTKHTLAEQRKLNSEDAGALAFLFFIEGFMKMIINKVNDYQTSLFNDEIAPELEAHLLSTDETILNRYCTEVLLKKSKNYANPNLKEYLKQYGDSIVLSENNNFVRVHIHTNTPQQVVRELYNLGTILETKAEDMLSQQTLANPKSEKFALIIDSIADFPAENLPNFVYLLPINLLVDGVTYIDKRTAFSALLRSGKASSSQPNYNQIKTLIEPIAQKYEDVFVLTVSSKMSGIYNQFKQAVQNLSLNNVTIIDTKRNSVAEGLIVDAAIEIINKNKDKTEIINKLNNLINRTEIFVSLDHMKAMIASGRLNERIGWFFQKIGFLPLITINKQGEGKIKGVSFSKNKNIELLINTVKKHKDDIEKYALVHANAPEKADNIAKRLTQITGQAPYYIENISSIIELFSGDGSVAVGYIIKSKTKRD